MVGSPVRVITVEREYGSRGAEFAHDLAARLGWRLLDAELVAGAARSAGVDPKLASKFDEPAFPESVPAERHHVVEPVVPARDAGEQPVDLRGALVIEHGR